MKRFTISVGMHHTLSSMAWISPMSLLQEPKSSVETRARWPTWKAWSTSWDTTVRHMFACCGADLNKQCYFYFLDYSGKLQPHTQFSYIVLNAECTQNKKGNTSLIWRWKLGKNCSIKNKAPWVCYLTFPESFWLQERVVQETSWTVIT